MSRPAHPWRPLPHLGQGLAALLLALLLASLCLPGGGAWPLSLPVPSQPAPEASCLETDGALLDGPGWSNPDSRPAACHYFSSEDDRQLANGQPPLPALPARASVLAGPRAGGPAPVPLAHLAGRAPPLPLAQALAA